MTGTAVTWVERKIGTLTLRARCDADLAEAADSLLELLAQTHAEQGATFLRDGLRVGFGWSLLTLSSIDGKLVVCEPDFATNPFERKVADVSNTLRVQGLQNLFMGVLEVEPTPVTFNQKVVALKGALRAPNVYLQRHEPSETDSGWYIGVEGAPRPEQPEQMEAFYVYQLLALRPALLQAMLLPEQFVVIFAGDDVEAILDQDDNDLLAGDGSDDDPAERDDGPDGEDRHESAGPGPAGRLDLPDEVEHAFGFLASEYGFSTTERGAESVRFESAAVAVTILHDSRRSFELRLMIAPREPADDAGRGSFELHELLATLDVADAHDYAGVQVEGRETLRGALQRFATALHRHGSDALRGSRAAFQALATRRHSDVARYNDELQVRQTRDRVDAAWRAKDFATIVRLWSPLRDKLERADRAKLDFAAKKLGAA